jgi:hypothetical protein
MTKQISDQPSKVTASASDLVLIRDTTSNSDKKTTVSGLASGVAANLPNNSVNAAALASGAIKLGYTQVTANVTASGGATPTAMSTPLTSTVTVPDGRSVRVTFYCTQASGGSSPNFQIWDGPVGSGTQIGQANISSASYINCQTIVSPAAGTKTYNVGCQSGSGTATAFASATAPAYILVEAI